MALSLIKRGHSWELDGCSQLQLTQRTCIMVLDASTEDADSFTIAEAARVSKALALVTSEQVQCIWPYFNDLITCLNLHWEIYPIKCKEQGTSWQIFTTPFPLHPIHKQHTLFF